MQLISQTEFRESAIASVVDTAVDSLRGTSIGDAVDDILPMITGGKMLRARLVLRIGAVVGVRVDVLNCYAAALEMIHAASLLHDDVIDSSERRRGMPSFWVARGTSGAILLGDLLMCRALTMVGRQDNSSVRDDLLQAVEEMCDAEAEQELMLRGAEPDWATCISTARRKTGALFAFAASCCVDPEDASMKASLAESGYEIGTAYQLADDILDAYGDAAKAGKSLGNDAPSEKVTAASVFKNGGGVDPIAYVEDLCSASVERLSPWPRVRAAWREYMQEDLRPVIGRFVEHFEGELVS
ncbi:MAG: polyprenyl synthetase family protein [Kiritimatiellia bacterium]|jgi:geranylgeranyl pyrophosphate synthase|nr:polyprenyl synthetase family protein [Kiritimatiellia bacterium]